MNEKFYIRHPYAASILVSLLMIAITIAGNSVAFSTHFDKAINGAGYYLALTVTNIICIIIALFLLKKHQWNLRDFGFCSMKKGSPKKVLYFIPVIIDILFAPMAAGINTNLSPLIFFITFIFTITVGFTEEMYYRGFVFKYLSTKGIKKAILISSLIFGLVHISTALRGDTFMVVFMRICFAFVFGIVCAEIIYLTKSLWSLIIFHCLHDFMAYTTNETIRFQIAGISIPNMLLIFEIIEFLILALYAIFLWKKIFNKQKIN